MGEDHKPRKSAVPGLVVGTSGGIAFGYYVLGWFIRGPGDPHGVIVGPVFGGFLGLALGVVTPLLPRGWFRFSLQTLFIVVTAAALGMGWVVYSLNWISARHEFRTVGGYMLVGSDEGTAPGLLWLFGERGYDRLRIAFPDKRDEDHLTQEQRETVDRVRRMYPEAELMVVPPYTGEPL